MSALIDLGNSASFRWAQRAGGIGDDDAYGLSITGNSVAVSGYVTPPASIGSTAFTVPAGYSAGFLALLPDAAALATAPAASLPVVQVYPNPAHQAATVVLPPGPATLTLFDAIGREAYTRFAYATTNLELAGLPPGAYTLRVTINQRNTNTQLLIE